MKGLLRVGTALLAVLIFVLPVSALEAPYDGYTYNYWGRSVPSPVIYTPTATVFGQETGAGLLKDCEDMTVYKDEIYILDSGNNRIVVLDSAFKLTRVLDSFKDSLGRAKEIKAPRGIFIKDDIIYIADSGNSRVIACDMEGNVVRELRKPKSSLIPDNIDFTPTKLAVDRGNNVYVQCEGYYYGLVAYNAEDVFTGFYGGNQVQLSLSMITLKFWKSIFNKEQRESLQRAVPVEYSNLYLVGDFIYTCTKKTDTSVDEVQKLNPMGVNILKATASVGYDANNFGDIETSTYRSTKYDNIFVDINVDENGHIALLDQERGRVFLYDQECNLLGTFGIKGSQNGALTEPVAIEKLNGSYLVLDKAKQCITAFSETEYMSFISEGIKYYSDGLYSQSIAPWKKVLQYNSRCSLAYISIGKAQLQQGEYKAAMENFKKGQDRADYSRALREYRKTVVNKYFLIILAAAVAAAVIIKKLVDIVLTRLVGKREKVKVVFE